MDALGIYRQAIEKVLTEYAQIPAANGDLTTEIIIDRERDRYLLVDVGWDNGYRIHGTLIHIDIIAGKLWIQCDGTEAGIALDLVAAGVPKDCIVLGFRPPSLRKHTDFAAA